MSDLVLRTDEGGCATLTLNRPDKLNALNVGLFAELDAHVSDIEKAGDAVRLVIVRGAGRCFSAGHDLMDIAAGERLPRPNFQASVIERLSNLPLPVISAVHGHCYTGALELALAGDLVVASGNAKFADTHARFALTPVWGLSQRLPRRVGTYKAREMMFTCRTYGAEEAAHIGLANAWFPDEGFEAGLKGVADSILANSSFSHRANKALLTQTDGLTQTVGLAHEVFRGAGRGPDMEARIQGFANRGR